MPNGSTPPDPAACRRGAARLVNYCARVVPQDRIAIIADPDTLPVARYVVDALESRVANLRLDVIPQLAAHGAMPPQHVSATFAWANVLFGLTRMSMAHTVDRKRATDRGARYLSLPDYSLEQLAPRKKDLVDEVDVGDPGGNQSIEFSQYRGEWPAPISVAKIFFCAKRAMVWTTP